MGQIKWYKRDPSAALNGMMELSLEERGAYNTVLDLIYSRDGNLHDDDRFIAGWLRVDVRVWKRIKTTLMERGKLYIEGDFLRNERADEEVLNALSRVGSARDAGRASARSKAAKSKRETHKNNNIASTDVGTDASTPVSTNHNHNQSSVDTDVSTGAVAPENRPKRDRSDHQEHSQPKTAADITKAIFDTGIVILKATARDERSARSMIGRWRKQYTDSLVLTVLARCEAERPSSPVEWITKALQAEQRKVNGNGQANFTGSPTNRNQTGSGGYSTPAQRRLAEARSREAAEASGRRDDRSSGSDGELPFAGTGSLPGR